MKLVERLLEAAAGALTFVAALGLLAMLVHVCADVALNSLMNAPIPGTAEIVAYYYMVGAVFLPLPLVELRGASIKVDLVYGLLPRGVQRVLLVVAYLAQTAFFAILARQTFFDAVEGVAKGQMVEGRINVLIWPGLICLPLAFGLAALVSLLLLWRCVSDRDFDPDAGPHEGEAAAGAGGLL